MDNGLSKVAMVSIQKILEEKKTLTNVNNVDKKILNNVNNVSSDKERLLDELLSLYKDKPEGVAEIITERLGDEKNLNFHRKVVKKNNPHILFEAVAIAEDAHRSGKIKGTKASYYVGILKKKGIGW